ncbi:Sestrin-1 [Collichthys lucidus]|uniref:Sestrin-1 n=1 Tax=Collichthys lucidus TaxID=240159 RepID=A0A4U5UMG4_COLLU|nr:Sestrin-1 [Collichthys lucidus]
MRHAVAQAENVENNSFAVTRLLKICTHCERLSKKDLGVRIPRPLGNGPSRFIPEKEILKVSKVDTRTQSIFEDAFAALGASTTFLWSWDFTRSTWRAFSGRSTTCCRWTDPCLCTTDTTLASWYTFYHLKSKIRVVLSSCVIAAAARHQCSYLVNLHVNDFLQVGGDPKWLDGLNEAPQKLQQLGELNKILAHRPWLLTKEHIETPSVSQFCVCDIANGNGHANHHDDLLGNQEMCGEVEVLMERMKQLQECRDDEEASQEEMATRFEREKTESMLVVTAEDDECVPSRDISDTLRTPAMATRTSPGGGNTCPHSECRLYPDVGQMLDEKFQMAYNLTYNTMATHKDVDTSMLRRAIWNYIHCMFGIRYDDYDYGEINQLLDRSFKIYIKTMVCSPEKTTKRMYESFWRQFQHSEKVHVNLLLMEARMQAELLYALRAITRYMT